MAFFRRRWLRNSVAGVGTAVVFVLFWCAPVRAETTHEFLERLSGFSQVIELAIAAGGLYAADRRKGAIVRVNASTGMGMTFGCGTPCEKYIRNGDELTGTPAGSFHQAGGVTVNDATGEIYVSEGSAVDVFAASGEYLTQITEVPANSGAPVTGKFSETAGLAFDEATSELYATNEGEHSDVVDVFKMEGGGAHKFTRQFGDGVLSASGGWHQQVAVVESGMLAGTTYVGNRVGAGIGVIDVFNTSGALEATWTGAKTISKSFGIQGLGVGVEQASGHVYVGDIGDEVVDEFPASVAEQKSLGRLKNTPNGQFTFTEPRAVLVDPATGNLYVGDGSVVDMFGPGVSLPEVEEPAPYRSKDEKRDAQRRSEHRGGSSKSRFARSRGAPPANSNNHRQHANPPK